MRGRPGVGVIIVLYNDGSWEYKLPPHLAGGSGARGQAPKGPGPGLAPNQEPNPALAPNQEPNPALAPNQEPNPALAPNQKPNPGLAPDQRAVPAGRRKMPAGPGLGLAPNQKGSPGGKSLVPAGHEDLPPSPSMRGRPGVRVIIDLYNDGSWEYKLPPHMAGGSGARGQAPKGPGRGLAPDQKPNPALAPNQEPNPALAPNQEGKPGLAPNQKPNPGLAPDQKPNPALAPNQEANPGLAPNQKPNPALAPNQEGNPDRKGTAPARPSQDLGPAQKGASAGGGERRSLLASLTPSASNALGDLDSQASRMGAYWRECFTSKE